MKTSDIYSLLEDSADYVINMRASGFQWAPGFEERARVAAGYQSKRTIRTPTFLTDLGVRRINDPTVFYEEECVEDSYLDSFRKMSSGKEGTLTVDLSDIEVAHLLDRIVLLWGDYNLSLKIIKSLEDLRKSRSYSLLNFGANLYSQDDPLLSESLLDEATKVAETPGEVLACELRKAAVVLKRLDDPERALRKLRELRRRISSEVIESGGTESDMEIAFSMSLNLEALANIRAGRKEDALNIIIEAQKRATVDDLMIIGKSEALRYRTQITGNAARMAWMMGESDLSMNLWKKNYDNALTEDKYSLSETLFALAYGHYLSEKYQVSSELSQRAARMISEEASPRRLAVARKVWAGSEAKMGKIGKASEILNSSKSDPLGAEFWR